MYLLAVAASTTKPTIKSFFDSNDPDHDPNKEIKNWASIIGITTAIIGNVLIALALNVQRYAHIRLHRQRRYNRARAKQALKNASNGGGTYGTITDTNGFDGISARGQGQDGDEGTRENDPLAQSFESGESQEDKDSEQEVSSTYLRDPYWWLGQVLITVGECGNFLAYGFAPASIVSPLGVVALISNCVIAPLLFKEVFRKRDFWGVIIAVAGAVTVVLSANTQETKLEPHDVWNAITTMEFEIYVAVTCSLIAVLMWASPRYGNRTILIDLGLVGLFGGYTALSTKGVSSMLSSTFLGAFTTPVTYVLVLVLLGTAIMQVRYVNRALQRFDSTQVIPIQFVMFTLCVIIGSAVLYRDFERTTSRQAAKFVGGCLLTFFGVFLITTGRPRHDEEEETLSDEEGVEETIGLREQDQATAQHSTTQVPPRRGSNSARSRRSSKSSRVNFGDATNKPLTAVAESGVPSLRISAPSKKHFSPVVDEIEDTPLVSNPYEDEEIDRNNIHAHHQHRLETPAISSNSVPTINSKALSDTSTLPSSMPHNHPQLYQVSSHPDHSLNMPRPATSASRAHSHVFNGTFLSPSPFSSTVSGALADKLLPHLHTESSLSRRVRSRRSRPSLRNSLYVSQEDLDDEALYDRGAQSDREVNRAVGASRRRSHYSTTGEESDEEDTFGQQQGFRSRARSFSNTLGELLGVRRKSRAAVTEGDGEEEAENQPFIARRTTDQSHATL